MQRAEICLSDFEDSYADLLAKWLDQEDVARWFGESESFLEEVLSHAACFEHIHHFLVWYEDRSAGYARYTKVSGQPLCFSLDYFIASPELRGKGLGTELIRILCQEIQSREKPYCICASPVRQNVASCRVLEKNGFQFDEAQQYYCKVI